MKSFSNYVKASYEELTKVVWPTKKQAVKLTIIVLTFCAVFAVALGALDLGLNEGYDYLLDLIAKSK